MRLVLCAMVTLLLAGCRYRERDLTCDAAAAGCGGGEACAVRPSGMASCTCGDLTSTGRACATGTSCSAATCVVNLPPSAVISRVVDGVLRVASNGNALLTGRESTDPEGGSLTYAWGFSGACGVPPEALDTRDITLVTTGITDGCTVTLIVTDDFGETATASATIVARAIGAYVATVDQVPACLTAYDAASEDPQGTYDHPFCDLAPAMTAAADNSLPEVSIATNALLYAPATVVVTDLALVGGYTISLDAPWVVDPTKTSQISTARADIGGTPLIRLSGGSTALTNLLVSLTTGCTGGCTTLEVEGTTAALTRVTLAAGTGVSQDLTVIAVHSATDATTLTLDACQIDALTGSSLVAMDVDGPADVRVLNGSTISTAGGKTMSIAARVANSAVFEVHGSTLQVVGSGAGTSMALKDGRHNVIDGSGTCAGEESCASAASILLDAATLTAASDATVYGAVLLGSPNVTMKNNTIITGAVSGNVIGLQTMDVAKLEATGTSVSVTGIATSGIDKALAFNDGYSAAAGSFTNGSKGIAFGTGTSLTARGGSAGTIESLSAILLTDTAGATFDSTAFVVTKAVGDDVNVWRAVGATTHATSNVHFNLCTFDVSGVIAQQRVSAFADGCGSAIDSGQACSNAITGSTGLQLTGNVFRADMKGAAGGTVRRICTLLAGSDSGVFTDNQVLCSTELGFTTNEVNAGLWLLATTNMQVERNNVALQPLLTTHAQQTWHIGILDGLYPSFDNTTSPLFNAAASSGLTLNRNAVAVKDLASQAYAVGVWYRGAPSRPLYNSIIDLTSLHDYGVILDQTTGVVELNTIRATNCFGPSACTGYGVGVYVLLGAGNDSFISGNLFTWESTTTTNGALAIVNHRTNTSTAGGIANLTYNTFGRSGKVFDNNGSGVVPQLYAPVTNANSFPGDPTGPQFTTDDETMTVGTLLAGAKVDENQSDNPVFCGGIEVVRNTGAGNNLVATESLPYNPDLLLTDFANAPRATGLDRYDAGATERGTLTCLPTVD